MATEMTDDDLDPQADDTMLGDEDEIEIDLGGPDEEGVTDNGDGTLSLEFDDDTEFSEDPEFYSNLADGEVLDPLEIAALTSELMDRTDEDKETHKARVEQYADAIKRLGLDGNAPVGADFEGASKAVAPMMIEAAIDFQASAIRELMPEGGEEGGPVKHKVVGKPTQRKFDRAVRKARHMNWQLTEQMPTFRDTMEVLLTQLAMGGRQYLKMYQNLAKNRPEELFVNMADIWLPAGAQSFYQAFRKTHAQKIDKLEMQSRMKSGMYLTVDLSTPQEPEKSAVEQANDKAAGKTESQVNNEDGIRLIREIYVLLSIESDPETNGEQAPYIVTIDDDSRQLLSIYRDWDPEDPNREPLEHIIEFPFVNWDGSPIGLPQLIGGLSVAATGALNALLDSAHLNNLSGAVSLKGKTGKGGQNIPVNAGQITQIDAPVDVDDIRKLIMPLPFNQPSPVLFQLLGFLTEGGKGVTNVALEKIAEAKGDMPVGTTLALIEQGAKVYASIHARLHRAMKRVLKALHQLNRQHLDERALAREAGEILAKRDDYEGPFDVVPVSDPNIFSETQRFAQIQAVAARASAMPMLYDLRKVEEMILKRLKLPDGTDLLLPKPEPQKLNPVNENAAAAMGQPIIAFPDQDHAAHLRAHVEFLQNPMFGGNPLIQPILLPLLLPHIKDHMVYLYIQSTVKASEAAASMRITNLMDDDDDVSNEMDDLLSMASSSFLEHAAANFDDLLPPPQVPAMPGSMEPAQPQSEFLGFLAQMNQLMQSFAPPQPMDPTAVQAQEVQRKSAADQQTAQVKQIEAQEKVRSNNIKEREVAAKEQANVTDRLTEERLQTAKLDTTKQIASQNNQTKILTNVQDNQTALTIANAEIEAGDKSDLSTGGGIDPGNT